MLVPTLWLAAIWEILDLPLILYLDDSEVTVHHNVERERLAKGGGTDARFVAERLEVVGRIEGLGRPGDVPRLPVLPVPIR